MLCLFVQVRGLYVDGTITFFPKEKCQGCAFFVLGYVFSKDMCRKFGTGAADLNGSKLVRESSSQEPGRASESDIKQGTFLILLAEDNAINQIGITKNLGKAGLGVDVVANGKEALDALSRTPYDLILMDCRMPVMNGFEATASIRSLEGEIGSVPTNAITANRAK
jgi:hypothetical protein